VEVFNLAGSKVDMANDVEVRLRVDDEQGIGVARVVLSRVELGHSPGGYGDSVERLLLIDRTVEVPGLTVEGDRLVLRTEDGETDCGEIRRKKSGRAKLKPNGRCVLEGEFRRVCGIRFVVVRLLTKEDG
jgi:hypothetical protein